MAISCSAYGCTNRKTTGDNLNFHRFPLNKPELLKRWVIATKRGNWQPTKFSFLCGEHFTAECYKSSAKHFLKAEAVPTLFNFSARLRKPNRKRRLIKTVPPKILEEKKQIESTYEQENINSSNENDANENVQTTVEDMSDGDENSESSDEHSNQSNEIKINEVFSIKNCERSPIKMGISKPDIQKLYFPNCILAANESKTAILPSNSDTCSNSNVIKVQYVSPVMLNELSSCLSVKQTVNTCDASTSTEISGSKEYGLRQQLANSDILLNRYRKKIKMLQQQNRRYKDRLRNVNHSIFTELLKRQYLSSDSYFKTGQPDCVLDRQSIRPCISSESEKSDQDE